MKLDKTKWFVSNPFDVETSDDGSAFLIDSNTDSPFEVSKIPLEGNSISKYLMKRIRR